MAKDKDNKQVNKSGERPWGALTGLALGAVIMYAIVWIGALHSGEKIAEFYAKDHARDWTRAVVQNLDAKKQSFNTRNLKINDKYALQDFQKGTNIYRYSLADKEGRIFESSKIDQKGRLETRPAFKNQVKNGEIIAMRSAIKAQQLDGFTMQTHVKSVDDNAIRQVIEVILPIMDNGKFVGAMFIHDDITNLLLWSNTQAQKIAYFLVGIVTLVFLAIASMVWSYGSARTRQNKALMRAKHEAEGAEKEAREMADQLQKMNDDIGKLNQELNENMTTLRNTQNEVIRKGKMAQLGQLTATVAHDIRNPLGSIRTSAFLLRRKFAADNPMMEKPLARIEKGVERCDGIITQLLDFARSKDIDPKMLKFDDWLVELLREQTEQLPQEVMIECTVGLDDKEYSFDPDNLARAVINLLTNASEAMVGKGSDKPENPTQNPKISVSTARTDRGIEIVVSDNGPGITPANLEKIRDPLFTTKSFGVGLGLPAIEKVFEQHDGGMEVRSVEGQGATFTGWIAAKTSDKSDSDDRDAEQAA